MKKLYKNPWILIVMQIVFAFVAYYSLGIFALAGLAGSSGGALVGIIGVGLFGLGCAFVIMYSLVLSVTQIRTTKKVTIGYGLLLIFSLTMIFLPIYEFHIVPHRETVEAVKRQTDEIALKKELSAAFQNPQTVVSVNKDFDLVDKPAQKQPLVPPSHTPVFTLDNGQRIISEDLIQSECRIDGKVDENGSSMMMPEGLLGAYAETFVGTKVTITVDTWQGFPNFQSLRAFNNYQKNKTEPIPVHISIGGKLIGCDSLKASSLAQK